MTGTPQTRTAAPPPPCGPGNATLPGVPGGPAQRRPRVPEPGRPRSPEAASTAVSGTSNPASGGLGEGPPDAGRAKLAAAMTEDDLERAMRRILADLPGVLTYHTRDSRRSASGYPDWTFASRSGQMFRELKRQSGKVTPAQQEWLKVLNEGCGDADVWRPSDLLSGRIGRELAALAGLRSAEVAGELMPDAR